MVYADYCGVRTHKQKTKLRKQRKLVGKICLFVGFVILFLCGSNKMPTDISIVWTMIIGFTGAGVSLLGLYLLDLLKPKKRWG